MARAKVVNSDLEITRREWEVEDALRTLQRAAEIIKDKKMMIAVKKCAVEKAGEMKEVAAQADSLAKMGRISPKAMSKMGKTGRGAY